MGPFSGTLNIRGRIVIGTQKGTIILTTNHMRGSFKGDSSGYIRVYGDCIGFRV